MLRYNSGYYAFTIGKASLPKRFRGASTSETLFVVHAGLDEIEAALDVAFLLRDVSTG